MIRSIGGNHLNSKKRPQIRTDAWIGCGHRLELFRGQTQLDRQPKEVDQLAAFRAEMLRPEHTNLCLVNENLRGGRTFAEPVVGLPTPRAGEAYIDILPRPADPSPQQADRG